MRSNSSPCYACIQSCPHMIFPLTVEFVNLSVCSFCIHMCPNGYPCSRSSLHPYLHLVRFCTLARAYFALSHAPKRQFMFTLVFLNHDPCSLRRPASGVMFTAAPPALLTPRQHCCGPPGNLLLTVILRDPTSKR